MQVFSCEFCEISKNTFFTEHLWTTGSVYRNQGLTHDPKNLNGLTVHDFTKVPLIEAHIKTFYSDISSLSETFLDSSILY